jgi:hypothetical protein
MARTTTTKTLWARLLLPVSFLLLIHLFFPHDHHYNSFHSDREEQHEAGPACASEVTDALLRVSAEADSQCPAATFHAPAFLVAPWSWLTPGLISPWLPAFALLALLGAWLWGGGRRWLFSPYLCLYHAPRGSMVGALRAPPVGE